MTNRANQNRVKLCDTTDIMALGALFRTESFFTGVISIRAETEKRKNEKITRRHWELVASIVDLARKENHVVDFNKGDE